MAGIAPTPVLTTYVHQQIVMAADLNGIGAHITSLYQKTMGGFRTRKPFAGVSTTANHGLSSGIDAFLSFDSEIVDTDNIWSASNPNRFTINTAGWYRLSFQAHWDTNNAGQRVNRILVNGTNPNTNAMATDNRNCLGLGEGTVTFCQCNARLAAGALVYPYVTQNSGSTVNLTSGFSGCRFFLEWIAPYNT